MIHKAKDLSQEQKNAIESLLGRAIAENEAISVRTVPIDECGEFANTDPFNPRLAPEFLGKTRSGSGLTGSPWKRSTAKLKQYGKPAVIAPLNDDRVVLDTNIVVSGLLTPQDLRRHISHDSAESRHATLREC